MAGPIEGAGNAPERRRQELRRTIDEARKPDARWEREELLIELEEAWASRDLERADVLLALLIGHLGRERMRVAEEAVLERIAADGA